MKIPEIPAKARLAVKLAFLLLFVLFSLSGILPHWLDALSKGGDSDAFSPPREIGPGFLKVVLPALSPFAVFLGGMAQRELFTLLPFILASLAFLLALWRGRLFCAWVCPMGTAAELEARIFKKGLAKKAPKLNGAIFWTALVGALLGMPVLLALDPLSSFNRLGVLLHHPFPLAALIPAATLLLVLALGILKPMLWCSHVCPLGYGFGLVQKLRVYVMKRRGVEGAEKEMVSELRRDLLKGACASLPLAVASEGLLAASYEGKGVPVLPPGAMNAVDFHASCTRCYACVAACPSKVLSVKLPADLNFAAWFAPQEVYGKTACWEDCNRCSQVCAPGALRPLTKEQKKNMQIGLAKIDHGKCVAWAKGEACMACDEYCPYHAIASDPDANGTPRPVVLKGKCRGCGFCQMSCPVADPGPAIKVSGVLNQRLLKL